MVSEEIKNITDEFNTQGKMVYLDATTNEKIELYEKNMNIKLPSQYKEWLMFSDGGDLFLPAGIQLYGVEHKPLIEACEEDKLKNDYFIIGALATGDPILCDKKGEKISIYNQEGGRIEEDEIYVDFYSFLRDLYNLLGIGG